MSTSNSTSRTPSASRTRLSTVPTSATKSRQLSHLHSQLAQLTAHMADLENLLRMTAVQAEGMRGLGGYAGGMFMAASKVLGEETVSGAGVAGASSQNSASKAAEK
ncbi:DASH complex subunit Hsk3 like-domain-containing protein [Neohortaea acidophila]|uniref:DASH complex subunit Hsk3 like-domain-containing protein n=1 Tax=Neohortaea acidophila TaxID=245834 RepID=A0A6A6PK54_9PEZI|nr:DASH complex subunit Hsk3 like-domain-containing protein [Neohortaea acidophila]KAF2479647.1 DASH complex subunit Hsk3 like-domain-containing protein [Neohortaea acidophila]